ncbi:MAG: VanZ family protein [Actinobacteria bacterium]|nr:VanZ family protein [Actinomycetota bacterium]
MRPCSPPSAFLVSARWPGADRIGTVTWLAFALALSIEALQFVLGIGRVASIDDAIVAALGALLGYLAWVSVRNLRGHNSAAIQREHPVTERVSQ